MFTGFCCFEVLDNFCLFLDQVKLSQELFEEELKETLCEVKDEELEIEFLQIPDDSLNDEPIIPAIQPPKPQSVKRKSINRKRPSQFAKTPEVYTTEKIFEEELNGNFIREIDTLNVTEFELNEDGTLNEIAQNRLEMFNWANQSWKCGLCEDLLLFGSEESLTIHCQDVHLSVAHFKCGECGYNTTVKSRYFSHIITHKEYLKFCCRICSLFFVDCIQLQQHHAKVHKRHKCFICLYCGAIFSQGVSLSKHKIVHQPRFMRGNYECDRFVVFV
jgi:hypothetical protein